MKKNTMLVIGAACLSMIFAVSCGSGKSYASGLRMVDVAGGEYESPNYSWFYEDVHYFGTMQHIQSTKDMKKVTIPDFQIATTETTYATWYDVLKWATDEARGDKRYRFENNGREGMAEAIGTKPGKDKNHPVGSIGWETAIVWCNALSEKNGFEPVYYFEGNVLRNEKMLYDYNIIVRSKELSQTMIDLKNTLSDETISNIVAEEVPLYAKLSIDETKNGFRLPTVYEWVYAARGGKPGSYEWNLNYAGSDSASEVGWLGEECGWDKSNDMWNDLLPEYGNKDVAKKKKNTLGLYDMTGNVDEWTNTLYRECYVDGSWAEIKLDAYIAGGAWVHFADSDEAKLSISKEKGMFDVLRSSVRPSYKLGFNLKNYCYDYLRNKRSSIGFRVARTLTKK